jgi:hypothetical protein
LRYVLVANQIPLTSAGSTPWMSAPVKTDNLLVSICRVNETA